MKPLLLFLLILSSLVGYAGDGEIPKQVPNSYVSDYANVLGDFQLEKLNEKIYKIDTSSTVQIAILLIDHLPQDVEIEDYARMVGNAWGVGHANNGIVCVFALGDHKDRIEVARNIEGILPDVKAFEILESLKPFLRQTDYYTALDDMLTQIYSNISPEAKEQKALTQAKEEAANKILVHNLLIVLMWIILLGIPIGIVIYTIQKKKNTKRIAEQAAEDARAAKEYQEWLKNRPIKPIPDILPIAAVAAVMSQPSQPRHHDEEEDNSSSSSSYSSSSSSSSDDSSSSFGSFGEGGGFDGGGASSSW